MTNTTPQPNLPSLEEVMQQFKEQVPQPERYYHASLDWKDWINLEDWLRTTLTTRDAAHQEAMGQVLTILENHKVTDGIIYEDGLPPADIMVDMMQEVETIKTAINNTLDMAISDILAIARSRGVDDAKQ